MSHPLSDYYQNSRENNNYKEPCKTPLDLKEAYEIQHDNSLLKNKEIGAWKLGGTTSTTQSLFHTNSVYYGPIVSSAIFQNQHKISLDKRITKPKGELELSFKLSSKVKDFQAENLEGDKIFSLIKSLAPSVELPWSPFPLPSSGLNVLVADHCASGALILGKEVVFDKTKLGLLSGEVLLKSGNNFLTKGNLSHILGGPLEALRNFLDLALKHQIPLKENQWVPTGGASPCVSLPVNKELKVSFEQLPPFNFFIKS